MKFHAPRRRPARGFTLVEMIGVLAIIAILASLLLPRIFSAINDARVTSATLAVNSAKSAAMTYFGKYGRFGDINGAAITDLTVPAATNWAKEQRAQSSLSPIYQQVTKRTFLESNKALSIHSSNFRIPLVR